MAQSSPLLRPHRLPLFTRPLNEAAGAAEMNQNPGWAWEGRRTGRPGDWGEDQQDEASKCGGGGGVVMPCLREKGSINPVTLGAVPPLPTSNT